MIAGKFGSVKDWFLALSQREKIMVSFLGLLFAAIVIFYGIIRPFSAALEDAEKDYIAAVERQGRVETKAAMLTEPLNKSVQIVTGDLDVFISQYAGEAGFAVGRLDPQTDGSVILQIDAAKPAILFGWLSKLEARGISARELSVNPGANETVSATVTLKRGAEPQ